MTRKITWIFLVVATASMMASLSYGASIVDGPVARNKLKRDAKELLFKEKFQELEMLGKELRSTKARFPEGHWKLAYYYEGLSTPKEKGDAQWRRWFERLETWQHRFPESVTARVAAGKARMEYGWEVRGGGYANTVTEGAWKELADCSEKALSLANQAPKNPMDDCPERYHLLLQIGKSNGWDREAFWETFTRATKFEPRYYSYYATAMDYLSPRWSGQEGEWISFVDNADSLAGKKDDREIYTRMVIGMWQREWQTFDEVSVSWTKMKKGFYDMQREYPASVYNLNNFAKFSCLARDLTAAKAAFVKIGNAPYFAVWEDRAIDFDTCRAWAEGNDMKSRLSRKEIYQSGRDQESVQIRQLAEDGDACAQNWAGVKYGQGEWGKQDYLAAFKWFQLAAESGYAPAQASLGVMYANGTGLKRDEQEAFTWYQRAAFQNDETGKFFLGIAYEQGKGTTKNLSKAYGWLSNLSNRKGVRSIDTIWNKLNTEERKQAVKETQEIKNILSKVD